MSVVVNNIAYRKGVRLGEITIEDISEVLKEPDTFIWLGLHEPPKDFLIKLQEEFSLHDLAIEDARNAHQRPKIETYGDSLFIVLKTAHLVNDVVEYGETHLFVGKHFLVSLRHGASSSYTVVRDRCEEMVQMMSKGPSFALYALMDFVVDGYQAIVTDFEIKLDELEASIFNEDFDPMVIEKLYDLKRQVLQLRSAAFPVQGICSDLMRFHEEIIPKDMRVYFRDIQDHASRVISSTEGMREMLTTAMQVNLALVAVKQNDIVKRLAGWGAILVIPTVIFSLYGMNFEFMPELKWEWGYPMTLLLTVLACWGVYAKLERTGWL